MKTRKHAAAPKSRVSRAGMRVVRSLLVCCVLALPVVAAALPVGDGGRRLVAVLDSMQVEQHWPAGAHVHWQTGIPDGKPERGEGKHTHCSAFVAAVAQRIGVYILRPPEHAQTLLANAQYDWLDQVGTQRGWQPVSDAVEAQRRANRGELVVAAYRNHHDDKPGHIAIVRPSDKGEHLLRDEGPQITQAGASNYTSTSLRRGFAGHPAAWEHHEVRFYAHAVDWH